MVNSYSYQPRRQLTRWVGTRWILDRVQQHHMRVLTQSIIQMIAASIQEIE